MRYRFGKTLIVGAALTSTAWGTSAQTQMPQTHPMQKPFMSLTADQARARATAVDAYIYGYPLVTMEMTRRVMTNTATAGEPHAPMGQLVRMRKFPDPTFVDVTAPNADTLYTTAWLDVGKEPWILSLPDSHGRYYLMPMLDGWTNVFQDPGTRTTGNGPQTYAITGPGWSGTLPKSVTEYKSPTSMVWLLGRIYSSGTPEDYAAVHAMQDQVKLYPLSAWGKTYAPPAGKVDPDIDMKTPVRDQVNRMDAVTYFNLLSKLMVDNPPAAADRPMVAKMAEIGFVPGHPFDATKLGADSPMVLHGISKEAAGNMMMAFKTSGTRQNGWMFTTKTGVYGTDYLNRALVTAIGLGANLPEDAVYPTSESDAAGDPYDGRSKYVMHFDKGQMPPAKAFWSLTMYNGQFFFVENPLNRYKLGSANKFVTNADGSVDLYLQHENPGSGKEANWLPAPDGRFIPMLRLYWPDTKPPSILDGTWKIPPVKKVE
jgi:hypothetical protein